MESGFKKYYVLISALFLISGLLFFLGSIWFLGRDLTIFTKNISRLDYVSAVSGVINVKDFQAFGDGVKDDSNAIQQVIDSAPLNSTIYFPLGKYRLAKTVLVNKTLHISADEAIFFIDHGGDGFIVGTKTAPLSNGSISGLNIKKQNSITDWNNEAAGLRLMNVYGWQIDGLQVVGFKYGIYFQGAGAGCVYNKIFPVMLWDNKYGVYFHSINGGWANQNIIMGGRWGGTTVGGDGAHIFIADASSNGNVFYSPSLEWASSQNVKAFVINGSYNAIYSPRTEGSNKGEVSGNYNIVIGGPYLYSTNIIDNGRWNRIETAQGSSYEFSLPYKLISGGNNSAIQLYNRSSATNKLMQFFDAAGKSEQGYIKGTGEAYFSGGIILKSPDGKICKKIGIGNDGATILTGVVCP